jgi:hypothetical protein
MGEIADMMLDGTLCEGCGGYIEGDGCGFPRYCSAQCANDRGADFSADDRYAPRVPRFNRYAVKPSPKSASGKVACPVCHKRLKPAGVGDHIRDVHPETQIGGAA